MGILGKDLLDLYRPYTHTKVLWGSDYYWVEYCPTPQPYGITLLHLLEYNADCYLQYVSSLKSALEHQFLLTIDAPSDKFLTERLLADDGKILNKYFWAAEDICQIKERYTWFLDEMFRDIKPEKQIRPAEMSEPLPVLMVK